MPGSDLVTHTLDVPAARLYYERRGTGPLLLMIGSPMDSAGFADPARGLHPRTGRSQPGPSPRPRMAHHQTPRRAAHHETARRVEPAPVSHLGRACPPRTRIPTRHH